MTNFVGHYNTFRLNNAIGYVAPAGKLHGRDKQIFKDRDVKLEAAREARRQRRGSRKTAGLELAKAMGRHKPLSPLGRAQAQGLNNFQLITAAGDSISN